MNSGHLTTLFGNKIGKHFTTGAWGGRKTNCPLDNHTGTIRDRNERWGLVTPTGVGEGAFFSQRQRRIGDI